MSLYDLLSSWPPLPCPLAHLLLWLAGNVAGAVGVAVGATLVLCPVWNRQ